jgi:predicted O-methyltransferase YrrM
MMIGGPKEVVQRMDPIFKTLAPGRGTVERTPGRDKLAGTAEDGYLHCGPSGAGHFTKMIHNGVEYGLLQAYAEGFALLLLAMHGPLAGDIVEIGSFKGRSTCFLALGAKLAERERVTAIDHFTGSPEHQKGQPFEDTDIAAHGSTYTVFRQNLERHGLWEQVDPMCVPSAEAARAWTRSIRLLFIDGDHSYERTAEDFAAFRPFLPPESVVCFHDVGAWAGVTKFCQELSAAKGDWKFEFQIASLAAFSRAA